MHRSRQRQFDDVRSNAGLARSQNNSLRSSKFSQSSVSEACVNCINNIMAERQRQSRLQQKQKERAQFRKNDQLINSWVDQQKNFRDSMKKDALNHNSKMISQHKQKIAHEKQEDQKLAQKMTQNIVAAQSMMKSQYDAEKSRRNQYYQQIHDQYIKEIKKKDNQKFRRQRQSDTKSQGLPLYNHNITQQKLKYKQQIQRQIQQKKQRQAQAKTKNQLKQRQDLQQSKRLAQKYHADNYQAMTISKEQVFEGLKKIQQNKKNKIQNQRKLNNQQRMKQIKQQNEQRSRAIKNKMKEMQNYVNDLKGQLLQKQQKLKASKLYDSRFVQKLPKSTQQIQSQLQIKKQCKSCHKNYPQQFISPIPK